MLIPQPAVLLAVLTTVFWLLTLADVQWSPILSNKTRNSGMTNFLLGINSLINIGIVAFPVYTFWEIFLPLSTIVLSICYAIYDRPEANFWNRQKVRWVFISVTVFLTAGLALSKEVVFLQVWQSCLLFILYRRSQSKYLNYLLYELECIRQKLLSQEAKIHNQETIQKKPNLSLVIRRGL